MSSLLTTMAILLANYDEQKDYLSNFEPFVLDRLKAWPDSEAVRSKALAERLSEAFCLPGIPINTVSLLRDRAKSGGYLRKGADGKDYPDRKALDKVSEIAPGRTEALSHFNALADSVRAYASEIFDVEWSEKEVEEALQRFAEEFGVEMAMARHNGGLSGAPDIDDETMVVVHSFARAAVEREPDHARYLDELVKGSMLANVIYFQDLGTWTPQVDRLVAYLDTPFVLRLLEVEPEEVAAAALELTELLADFEIPLRLFEHTVEEVIGVLEAVKHSLTRARRDEFNPQTVSAIHRESIEHLLRRGWGAGDIQSIISELDDRLKALGATIESTPPYSRELGLDERRFEKLLEQYGYRQEHQIVKDVRSLAGIFRLRKGQVCRDLSKTPAILLTSNGRLVRASTRFFEETGHGSPVAHCVSDLSLTTQLWLRRPSVHPAITYKLLMAESYAALQPSAELWSRYLKKIAMQKDKGAIDDRQVKILVLSSAGREGLLEITRGNANRVQDDTPLHVLDLYEEIVSRPAKEQASRASKAEQEMVEENRRLRGEIKTLRGEAEGQGKRLATQDRQLVHQEQKIDELERWREVETARGNARAKRIGIARRLAGMVLVGCLTSFAIGIGVVDIVASAVALTVIWMIVGGLALCVFAWAFSLGRSWAWRAVLVVSVITGIFGAIYGALLSDSSRPDAVKAGSNDQIGQKR
jgi:hypothetical protein